MSEQKILLSAYVDKLEDDWREWANARLEPLMSAINQELRRDLYKEMRVDTALELYQKVRFWLFATQEELIYENLKKFGFDISQFEREMMTSLILTITHERENLDLVLEELIRNGVVLEVEERDSKYILETKAGKFSFVKADEYFRYQNAVVERLLKKEDLRGGCHEVAEELMSSSKGMKAITMICQKNLVEKYWHSVVLWNEEMIVDLTANLVMKRAEFFDLYNVQEWMEIDEGKLKEVGVEMMKYDESGTLWALLRIASYERNKNGKL